MTALIDRYGLPVSTDGDTAGRYILAVDNLLRAGPQLVRGFQDVLKLAPTFALAKIGEARALAIYGLGSAARAAAAQAQEFAADATLRERQHVDALALVVQGKPHEALSAIRAHLQSFPSDALVLQPALSAFGLIGFSGALDRTHQLLELLDDLAPHYANDWWFNSMRAYAEVDCDRVADAERRVQASLAQMPSNANAAHVRAHVYYELEQHEEGVKFLRDWLARNEPGTLLRSHLAWHLALLELGLGRRAEAWTLYEQEIAARVCLAKEPPVPPLNVLTDAASFLWRAELLGEPVRHDDWEHLSAFASARFPDPGVVYGDVHAAMAHARAGNAAASEKLRAGLAALASARPEVQVAHRIGAVLESFIASDWQRVATGLEAVRPEVTRLGGSRAQLDLIDRTLLGAYTAMGDVDRIDALCNLRPQLRRAA